MTTLVLHPLDTLFFRDGRPYNQDDPGQAEAASVFPPHPPTVVGAVRAALARAMGWTGGAWSDDLRSALGDGVDWQTGDGPLGHLRFSGPYVLKNREPRFPAPLCLVRGKAKNGGDAVIARLAPGTKLTCDLGAVRLPGTPERDDVAGWKPLDDHWISAHGMQATLAWRDPEAASILPARKVWRSELRVGIQRQVETRTTARFVAADGEPEKGALYATAHARPGRDIALAMEVEGLPDVALGRDLAPLGGEGRSGWIVTLREPITLPQMPELAPDHDGTLRYTVIHVTPADLGDESPGSGGRLRGADGAALPGEVVSACVGRPVPVGGWEGIVRRPLPLRPLIPAGSVWFMEAEAADADAIAGRHGQAVGRSTAWGFGRVLIGQWEEFGGTGA